MGESSRSKYDALPFDSSLVLIDRMAYVGGVLIYQGWAKPGSLEDSNSWSIKKFYYDTPGTGAFLGSDIIADFNQNWKNRGDITTFVPPSAYPE